MDKEFIDFCEKAIKQWGEESQLRMCIEEMSELTKELCKYIRLVKDEGIDDVDLKLAQTKKNIIEETADVLNCAEQMALMFGKDQVDQIRKEKIKRASKYFK